ncbi:MAG: type II toxin-antitoxin system PemK/MazF family toxin [Pseudomonadota bacterium]
MVYKQLEIYWVDLDPTQGAETRKKRPCVILQDDIVNKRSKTLIVAPILPDHKDWPFAVNIQPSHYNHLDKERHINLKQMRAIDISRVSNKLGQIESLYLETIYRSIKIVFGM